MLDQILDALAYAGFERKDTVFICGYQAGVVRERYPDLTFVENKGWESNNILLSLLFAREHMGEGFVSTYADIVYTNEIARAVARSPHAIALGCDTDWRRRYTRRTHHPESDAEKLRAEGERVLEISRTIPSEIAAGEFIGVMKVSRRRCGLPRAVRQHRGRVRRQDVSRGAIVPEGVPSRLPRALAAAGLGPAPRRHRGRLHGDRYPARSRVRGRLVARLELSGRATTQSKPRKSSA
jgi:choline kinase